MFKRRIVPLLLIALVVGLGSSLTTLSIAKVPIQISYPFARIASDPASAFTSAPGISCSDTDLGHFEYTLTLTLDQFTKIYSALVAGPLAATVIIRWSTTHTLDDQGFTEVGERWRVKSSVIRRRIYDTFIRDSTHPDKVYEYSVPHEYILPPDAANHLAVGTTFTVTAQGHALAKIPTSDCAHAPPMGVYAEWKISDEPKLVIIYKEKESNDIP